ncbi:hypothetical protein B0T26DRAFT_412791 [Lasiosphaeria miniovina]|uniref:Secreted protein n=1 Tax=Lasiosphaeria miniovina TaxID=1954250 RepID=A0AA40A5K6_9PEZI|nr:uncharacterized protein B0T26DRAFT_412791 [Lasiosphaeria miniovina]KAK0709591.1 hypothetical protein B0T26DRAFT_412791 [Lasiosphaeria miniovina]
MYNRCVCVCVCVLCCAWLSPPLQARRRCGEWNGGGGMTLREIPLPRHATSSLGYAGKSNLGGSASAPVVGGEVESCFPYDCYDGPPKNKFNDPSPKLSSSSFYYCMFVRTYSVVT